MSLSPTRVGRPVLRYLARIGASIPVEAPSLVLAAALATFCAVVLAQSSYVPIWDSWIYAKCVVDAGTAWLPFERYGCAGHFSHAYVFLLALPRRLGVMGMPGILLVNVLLGVGAVLSLYLIARSTFPSRRYRLDCAMLASVWAVHPILLASAVFVNIDYGVMAFGLMTLASLMRGRPRLAAIFGLLLVFSKEIGSLVYALELGCYWVLVVGRGPGTLRDKLSEDGNVALHAAVLLVPAIYLRWLRPSTAPLWGNVTAKALVDQMTTVRLLDPSTLAALTGIFVLSFSWAPSALVLADVCQRAIAWGLALPNRVARTSGSRRLSCVSWLTFFLVFFLTRIQTSISVRYYAILYPLLLLAGLAATIRLSLRAAVRRTVFSSLVVLGLISSFRTVDPISKRIYGCFRFGVHQMLVMTSLNHECCGYGIDQLVYNLEFTRVHDALDAAVTWLRPSPRKPIVVASATDWHLLARMDPLTFHRTLPTPGDTAIPHLDLQELATRKDPPVEFDFLDVATANGSGSLEILRNQYDVTGVTRFGKDGYWFESFRMKRKQ
ncbi:MAG TPA: hypothetical protein VIV60_12470 [Polyangiaceae bacterium]